MTGGDQASMLPEHDYLASLPRKRVTAGLLLFSKPGELLIVKPNYRDGWLIPGGVVEAGESPRQAAAREALEEIGLELQPGPLAGIDYVRRRALDDECLHFIFDGGALDATQLHAMRPQACEICAIRCIGRNQLVLLEPVLRQRVARCLDRPDRWPVYLENGEPVG